MASYGRNFGFRIPPMSENRAGRFVAGVSGGGAAVKGSPFTTNSGGNQIPIGAPVKVDNSQDLSAGTQLQPVILATSATAPVGGQMGIAVYEYGPAAFAGDDPFLTTYSDKDLVPSHGAVQVVSGPYVKVVFTNTVARSFLHQRDYPGRLMVAGLGATPTLAVGDFLTPGTGNDTDGYWAETSNAADAWLVVTGIDTVRGEVEARVLF